MIKEKFLREIGLNEDQIGIVTDALEKESRFRSILVQIGVYPGIIEPIYRKTDYTDIEFENEDLLRLKLTEEWKPVITKKCQK